MMKGLKRSILFGRYLGRHTAPERDGGRLSLSRCQTTGQWNRGYRRGWPLCRRGGLAWSRRRGRRRLRDAGARLAGCAGNVHRLTIRPRLLLWLRWLLLLLLLLLLRLLLLLCELLLGLRQLLLLLRSKKPRTNLCLSMHDRLLLLSRCQPRPQQRLTRTTCQRTSLKSRSLGNILNRLHWLTVPRGLLSTRPFRQCQ